MKKGTIGTIIGVIFFIGAMNFVFADGFRISSFTPFIFLIIFSVGVPLLSKKAKEAEKNKKDNKYDRYGDSKYGSTMSTRVNCHKCNSVIEKSDKYCPHCGASQRDTIICEYCGHENPKDKALCENCNGFL